MTSSVSRVRVLAKDYKGGYRLVSKIKDEGFEADLHIKH
jgi:hypothetical protein